MRLNEIRDNAGATKNRKRVGRGIGSGTGKTAAKGQKGQKSRSGVSLLGFEGGQMPLYRRLPKRGFNKPNRVNLQEVSLGRIQAAIDSGKLDAGATITDDALVAAGVVRRKHDGVRLLNSGTLTSKVTLDITSATSGAVAAVEGAGGSISVAVGPKEKTPRNDRAASFAAEAASGGDDE